VLVPRYPLCLLHQERAEALMLELCGISRMHGNGSSIDCAWRESAQSTRRRGVLLRSPCSSRTILVCPSCVSSGRKVMSEHLRNRSRPTRISRSGSSYERKVSQPAVPSVRTCCHMCGSSEHSPPFAV
jgi:hypothetical protein